MSDLPEAVRRMLGPAGADSGCDRGLELLDLFVETELAGGNATGAFPDVAAHLEGCPDCREDYLAVRRLAGENDD